MAAARHHQLEPERIAYTQRDKKQGFLRVGRRVVIEVDPASPEKPEAEVEPARNTVAPGGANEQVEPEPEDGFEEEDLRSAEPPPKDEIEAVDRSVQDLIRFAGLDLSWSIRRGEEAVEIELEGYDRERLAEDDGATMQALEHLVPRLVRGWIGHGTPVKVDCDGFQEAREQRLAAQARAVAEEVISAGEAQHLEPMNPADRRIIHLALAEEPGVETESEGEGLFKRVRVDPV